jgi:hypothetical protein
MRRKILASRAAVPRKVGSLPAIFWQVIKNATQPRRSPFAAPPTPAGTRHVRVTLCDGPTLSETRGRPFVAPRTAVPQNTRQVFQLWTTCHPASTLLVCCSSDADASRPPTCAGDVMRWPDTVGDSGAAVCGSSGGGASEGGIFARQSCDLVEHATQPQRFLFAAPPTPAGPRRVRLTLCDGPTLSETQGRPFVAPRAAVPRNTRQVFQLRKKCH